MPFPDIAAEALGIMMEHKFYNGVDKVVQHELIQNGEERARLAALNSGLDFGAPQ